MQWVLIATDFVLVLLVLLMAVFLVGTLQAMGRLSWRVQQIETTSPTRLGRSGLPPGSKAPDFTLPSVQGANVSLHDYVGRPVLIVFTQAACSSCGRIISALNKLERKGTVSILVVNNGSLASTVEWAHEIGARCTVLSQEDWEISRRYGVRATPFAFLLDEHGYIGSKGVVTEPGHLGYVFMPDPAATSSEHSEAARSESKREFDRISWV